MNLLATLMVLLPQTLLNLAIAAIAKAILMRISSEHEPSFDKVSSRYLKLVTSSNFWPFMLMFALMWVSKIAVAAPHKIDVVGDTQAAYRPTTKGDRCLVLIECFLYDLLKKQVSILDGHSL